MRTLIAVSIACLAMSAVAGTAVADDCGTVNSLLQQGFSVVETARRMGIPSSVVVRCKRGAGDSVRVPLHPGHFGAGGPPPVGAAGAPPLNAAGPPPLGAAGPPPRNAAGLGPGAVIRDK